MKIAGGRLVVEPGDDHGPDLDAPLAQVVDELHGVDVVGDAEIGPHLLPLDVAGVDAEEEIGLVLRSSWRSFILTLGS